MVLLPLHSSRGSPHHDVHAAVRAHGDERPLIPRYLYGRAAEGGSRGCWCGKQARAGLWRVGLSAVHGSTLASLQHNQKVVLESSALP